MDGQTQNQPSIGEISLVLRSRGYPGRICREVRALGFSYSRRRAKYENIRLNIAVYLPHVWRRARRRAKYRENRLSEEEVEERAAYEVLFVVVHEVLHALLRGLRPILAERCEGKLSVGMKRVISYTIVEITVDALTEWSLRGLLEGRGNVREVAREVVIRMVSYAKNAGLDVDEDERAAKGNGSLKNVRAKIISFYMALIELLNQ